MQTLSSVHWYRALVQLLNGITDVSARLRINRVSVHDHL